MYGVNEKIILTISCLVTLRWKTWPLGLPIALAITQLKKCLTEELDLTKYWKSIDENIKVNLCMWYTADYLFIRVELAYSIFTNS